MISCLSLCRVWKARHLPCIKLTKLAKKSKVILTRCLSSFEKTVKRFQKHTGCEKRSQFWRSRFVFRPRGTTRPRQSRCKGCPRDSCYKPWSQPDPIRSYKSFRNFGAWFCTTKTPKLLTWLKNVLIRHTFVLKFAQNKVRVPQRNYM